MTSGGADRIPRRVESLDGLRGVAALVVVIHHSFLLFPALAVIHYTHVPISDMGSWEWWWTHTPLHILWDGSSSVFIFFVLSGMVLVFPVLRSDNFGWLAYYAQRLVRLYVPVWGAVALAVAIIVTIPRIGTMDNAWLEHHLELTWKAVVQDLTLLRGAGQVASPLWSLEWEVLFSLFLPVYFWVARKWSHLSTLKFGLCIAASGFGAVIDSKALTYLPMFLVGVVMAVERRRLDLAARRIDQSSSPTIRWFAAVVIALSLLTAPWLLMPSDANRYLIEASSGLVLVGAALAVFIAWQWQPAKTALGSRPAQWLGRISFSLYLTHEPIVIAVGYLAGPGQVAWAVPVGISCSLIVAVLFYHVVERPGHRLAKAVHSRLSTRRPSLHKALKI